ncbi:murein hydrolase activator EnvC family protein [Candidatus Terasakiella magnetica]|uniref:murein hydrolase activator EnvC family protein n=1 Tax=Candidatus Terasakiella magnetica TaxID=1867952 RepID=UPI0013F4D742|nr:M23 family metallopeptidase [Candidatus Terasakiella magnetica]
MVILVSCGWVEVPSEGTGTSRYKSSSTVSQNRSNQRQIPGTVLVQKGDTVYGISRKHGVSVRSIIDANNLKAPFHLNKGQRLRLPQGPVHVVQRGDTLYSVSRQYRTDVYTLAKNNQLKSPYTLHAGQRLKLPGGAQKKPTVRNARTSYTVQRKPTTSGLSPRVNAQPSYKPTTVAKAKPRISRKSIPKPPPRSGSRFSWPTQGKVISRFGVKRDGLRNDGINISAKRGSAVMAAENGVVAYSGNELRGFGNMLLIKHSGGWITAYAHNEKILVKRGQKVKRGQTIASVGSSGGVTKPQLHFEIRRGMNPVNPKKYLGS